MAAATSTSLLAAAPAVSLPSSANTFRTAGWPVQHVPATALRSTSRCARLVVARASSEEQQKFPIRRGILAGILAAGAVLSSTGPVLADPLADAKSKVEEALSGVQTPDVGKVAGDVKGKVGNVPESAGKATSEVGSQVKGKIDGIFGKSKGPPFKFDALGIGSGAKDAVASKIDSAKGAVSQ